MSCKGCIYYESGDYSVGLQDGCTHDMLYDEDENIIDEINDLITAYMRGYCPLKETYDGNK